MKKIIKKDLKCGSRSGVDGCGEHSATQLYDSDVEIFDFTGAKGMTEYYNYITKDNDRWDLIAYKFYKNPTKYEPIIQANPDIPITPILESGIRLRIPVLEESETIQFTLPPWRK